MNKEKGLFIIGTRPEIIKTYPLINKLNSEILFTGQHFDKQMSKYFYNLVGNNKIYEINEDYKNSNHNTVTNNIKKAIDSINPAYVVVQGDTNSTLFGAIAAKYSKKKLFYIESGLRSKDLGQVEEYNRFIVSKLADINFCNHKSNIENLLNEGINKKNIYLSGSTVYTSLNSMLDKGNFKKNNKDNYILLTLHRPENTDNFNYLLSILKKLNSLNYHIKYIVHPRVVSDKFNNEIKDLKNLKIIEPVDYESFIDYLVNSHFVISDSGGLQEESAILRKILIIPRQYTERPELLDSYNFIAENTNKLFQLSKKAIKNTLEVKNKKLLYGTDQVIEKISNKILKSI